MYGEKKDQVHKWNCMAIRSSERYKYKRNNKISLSSQKKWQEAKPLAENIVDGGCLWPPMHLYLTIDSKVLSRMYLGSGL